MIDKVKKLDGADLIKVNEDSVKLMQLLARSEMEEWSPYNTWLYAETAAFFLILSILFVYCRIGIGFNGEDNGYHREIVSSDALSYIDGGRLVTLSDGNYPVAMPPSDATVSIDGVRKFPLLMVMVPTAEGLELKPLNIEDDSFLPRQGRTLALNILIGFTSAHAENRLQYDEKHGDVSDYKRKAYYYLEVRNGVGRMRRGYKSTRDAIHVLDELTTIYRLIN